MLLYSVKSHIEVEGVWLCVSDGEVCDGGGEGGAGDGDHMIGRGGVCPHLHLEPHMMGTTAASLSTWRT